MFPSRWKGWSFSEKYHNLSDNATKKARAKNFFFRTSQSRLPGRYSAYNTCPKSLSKGAKNSLFLRADGSEGGIMRSAFIVQPKEEEIVRDVLSRAEPDSSVVWVCFNLDRHSISGTFSSRVTFKENWRRLCPGSGSSHKTAGVKGGV